MIHFIIISALFYIMLIIKGQYDTLSKRILIPYALIWFISLALSTMGINGLYVPEDSTIYLLVAHLFMFLLGFSIKKSKRIRMNPLTESLVESIELLIRKRWFQLIILICMLYSLSLFAIYWRAVAIMQSLGELRDEFYDGNLYGPLYTILNTFFLAPFDYFLYPIFGYMCIKKRNWLWMAMFVYLMAHASLSGGRFGYVRILLGVGFVAFCLFSQLSKQYKKRMVALIIVAAVLGYGLVVVTSGARKGYIGLDKESIEAGIEVANEHLISYTSGPITAFDYALNNNYIKQVGGYKYGGLVSSSIINFIYMTVSRFGIEFRQPIEVVAHLLQDNLIYIGLDELYWNALFTSCMYYYFDFGIIGVLLIPLILGRLISLCVTFYFRDSNVFSLALVSFVFIKMIFSIVQYNFTPCGEFILVFLLYCLSKKKRKISLKNL